jgi:hypothetical protein
MSLSAYLNDPAVELKEIGELPVTSLLLKFYNIIITDSQQLFQLIYSF